MHLHGGTRCQECVCVSERAPRAGCETHSFLQASNLFPGFHVFASRLQELLVGQIKGLADS